MKRTLGKRSNRSQRKGKRSNRSQRKGKRVNRSQRKGKRPVRSFRRRKRMVAGAPTTGAQNAATTTAAPADPSEQQEFGPLGFEAALAPLEHVPRRDSEQLYAAWMWADPEKQIIGLSDEGRLKNAISDPLKVRWKTDTSTAIIANLSGNRDTPPTTPGGEKVRVKFYYGGMNPEHELSKNILLQDVRLGSLEEWKKNTGVIFRNRLEAAAVLERWQRDYFDFRSQDKGGIKRVVTDILHRILNTVAVVTGTDYIIGHLIYYNPTQVVNELGIMLADKDRVIARLKGQLQERDTEIKRLTEWGEKMMSDTTKVAEDVALGLEQSQNEIKQLKDRIKESNLAVWEKEEVLGALEAHGMAALEKGRRVQTQLHDTVKGLSGIIRGEAQAVGRERRSAQAASKAEAAEAADAARKAADAARKAEAEAARKADVDREVNSLKEEIARLNVETAVEATKIEEFDRIMERATKESAEVVAMRKRLAQQEVAQMDEHVAASKARGEAWWEAPIKVTISAGNAGFKVDDNMKVTEVVANTACDTAGVKVGMELTHFNNEKLQDRETWITLKQKVSINPRPWLFVFKGSDPGSSMRELTLQGGA
jgi:hypothetical protein